MKFWMVFILMMFSLSIPAIRWDRSSTFAAAVLMASAIIAGATSERKDKR